MKPDFHRAPFIAIWETTRACQLACRHCRARAIRHRNPEELTIDEAKDLIDQIAAMGTPLLVLTGGDPMERDDLEDLVSHAHGRGLVVSITPSATPKVTFERMRSLKEAGLAHWAFSLDGSTPEIHDRFRGIRGVYDLTMRCIADLHRLDIPLQINTTVSQYNVADLPSIAERVRALGAIRWSVFFLVPTGRARLADCLSPAEHETVLEWLLELADHVPYDIKTTEGPQIRRLEVQRARVRAALEAAGGAVAPSAPTSTRKDSHGVRRSEVPVWDGNGFIFVSHTGDVYPSGFLPLAVGNVRKAGLADIYRTSDTLCALRDPARLKGKCGYCEFRHICAGSRARAFAVTGDPLESDPFCTYIPDPRLAKEIPAPSGSGQGPSDLRKTATTTLGAEQ